MPGHCSDGPNVPWPLWPQQNCHQPPIENDPNFGRRLNTKGTRCCAPGREADRNGGAAAGERDGGCNQHGHCLCRGATKESGGAAKDGSQDERYRTRL